MLAEGLAVGVYLGLGPFIGKETATLLKTLEAANRSERCPLEISRSVQQTILIQRIYKDGIWLVNGKYTWVFIDEIYLFFKYFYSAQFLYEVLEAVSEVRRRHPAQAHRTRRACAGWRQSRYIPRLNSVALNLEN